MQVPPVQNCPSGHARHACPRLPHASTPLPAWHAPFASQQPKHVRESHVFAGPHDEVAKPTAMPMIIARTMVGLNMISAHINTRA